MLHHESGKKRGEDNERWWSINRPNAVLHAKSYNRIIYRGARYLVEVAQVERKGVGKRETAVWYARWREYPLNFRQTSPHDLLNDVADCVPAFNM